MEQTHKNSKKEIQSNDTPDIFEKLNAFCAKHPEVSHAYICEELSKLIAGDMEKRAAKARGEFLESGLSESDFNANKYRNDGELYPYIQDGVVGIMATIPLPPSRKNYTPEAVLALYQENYSLKEICLSLERSEKWVKKKLSTFGINYGKDGARFNQVDIPFGWEEKNLILTEKSEEQWILEKIHSDLDQGVSPEAISNQLGKLNIAPRHGSEWNPAMIERVIQRNKNIKRHLKIKKSPQ